MDPLDAQSLNQFDSLSAAKSRQRLQHGWTRHTTSLDELLYVYYSKMLPDRTFESTWEDKRNPLIGHGLFLGQCRQDVLQFACSIFTLQQNLCQAFLLAMVCSAGSFQDIKHVSYDGALCVRGRAHDPGNFLYSVIYCAIGCMRKATEENELQVVTWTPTSAMLDHLERRWPSLDATSVSHNAYEKKGDILESMLAMWRTLDFPEYIPRDTVRQWLVEMEAVCGAAARMILWLPADLTPLQCLNAFAIAYSAHRLPLPLHTTGAKKARKRAQAFSTQMRAALDVV